MKLLLAFLLFCYFATAEGPAKSKAKPKKKVEAKKAAPAPPPVDEAPIDFKLVEFFSVDKNPGKGKLTYTLGETTETYELGDAGGLYGIGVIFRGSQLPEPYNRDFGKNNILQIALGTLKGRLTGQVPQWSAGTLISEANLGKPVTFKLTVPQGKQTKLKDVALFLFTNPATPNEQNDEEKLKGTFFGASGTVTVIPKGKAELIRIASGARKYNFKMQTFTFDFAAKLGTPFNAQEGTLKGKIDFPVYLPYGAGAQSLTRKIATESLGGVGPIPGDPEGLSIHSRDVAGSTKKDAKRQPE